MLKGFKPYFFSITLLMSTAISAQDIVAIYKQVLKSDPRLLVGSLGVEVTAAQEQLAFGALLPQVSVTSSWTENKRLAAGSSKASFSGERHTLSVRQPLLDMPKYYAWKGSEEVYEQEQLDQQESQSLIRLDTVERYFGLLDAQDQLALVREEKTFSEKKVERIRALYKKQRVKITDLYEAEARLDAIVSSEIDAIQARDLAKEALSELTSHSVDYISPLSSTNEFIHRLENINEWSTQAVPENHSLMALRKGIEAAQSNMDQASAGHLPLVELQLTKQKSNIGFEYAVSPTTTTEVAGLNITMPLFSGGRTTAVVYEAKQRLELSRARYELKKREVIKESRDTFLVVNALARRIEAANKAAESAKKAYQATNRSFELGIATVSQVLDAQKDFSDVKRTYQYARYSYIVSKAELLQISGKLNDDFIYEISKWLH
jgi:outer membrane protein|tara:strand:+ start:850 stop:2151 length:1302 start_codon:yes stop_codon:yes gene_type:complete